MPRPVAGDDDEPARPLSNKQLIIIVSVLTTDAMNMSMMFSYVGLLVAHIGQGLSKSTAGYASGLLLGIFQGSQVLVLKHWGHLSDRMGRRPVLLFGMFCSVIVAVAFGFCSNLWMAMMLRFIHGLVTVGGATMKTVITEITDAKSAAKGFSWMSMARAVGTMVGPSVGGFLYDPNSSAFVKLVMGSDYHSDLFETYPALLPSMVLGVYGSVVWIVAFFNIPESNVNAQPVGVVLGEIAASLRRKLCCERPISPVDEDDRVVDASGKSSPGDLVTNAPSANTGVEDAQVSNNTGKHLSSDESSKLTSSDDELITIMDQVDAPAVEAAIGELQRYRFENCVDGHLEEIHARVGEEEMKRKMGAVVLEEDAQVVQDANNELNSHPKVSYSDMASHPALKYVMPVYMIVCSYNVCTNEIFPLYAIAYRSDGGLEFTSSLVGICFMINAAVSFIANTQFSKVTARVPLLTLFRMLMLGAGSSLFLLSFLSYINNTTLEVLLFIPISIVRSTCATWAFSICMMLVANVAPKKHLGAFMSMSHACGAIARCVSPIIASPLFAWSITGNHVFPFNHHLVFIVLALECLLSYILSARVSEAQVGRRFK